ncbi:MAG: ParB N-terminal domain-containing protein, partial [Planctomycetota bacterium]
MRAEEYEVEIVDIDDVHPSPENDDIYGEISFDTDMAKLVVSIGETGLGEPLLVSQDDFIVSGHRRYFAMQHLGFDKIPIRRLNQFRELHEEEEWRKVLVNFNPQRTKSPLMILKERLTRDNDDPVKLSKQLEELDSPTGSPDFSQIRGTKPTKKVGETRMPFLEKVNEIIEDLKPFWPLTVRTIHYQLLNHKVYRVVTKKGPKKSSLYRNDSASYRALVRLCSDARYAGKMNGKAIDDPTRPRFLFRGFDSLDQFVEQEFDRFLKGFHRNLQQDQPNLIVVVGEKGTLKSTLRPVCEQFQTPLYLMRGYASYPMWEDIASLLVRSGKSRLSLLSVTDWDPEGIDLPQDGARTLRDHFGIEVYLQRVGVTEQQVVDLELANDFNPAKKSSPR